MVVTGFKSVEWSLLAVISLILCIISTTAAESRAAVRSVLDCALDNDTYICTGAQYRMHCNTRMNRFSYQRYQYQNQYQCMSKDCICVGNNDTCACYYNTSSCFCENISNNITIPTAVRPVYDCGLYSDTYICTGAQYHMYCNTSVHDFHYYKYHYHCFSDNCSCIGDQDTCVCNYNMSSSCFCTNNNNSITIPAAVRPVYDCGLYNDTYICTGAQYRMYCNTRMHSFYYWKYQNQDQYQYECWSNNCNCVGNKDTCTCYSSTLSSCFCETNSNSITIPIPTSVSPVTDPDCVLQNNTYICTGSQYRMYCNTQMHDFSYQKYQFQFQYQCVNNDCDCVGNKDTCTCSSTTLSSCFCETYGNIIALTTAVRPVYDCELYSDTYICTGAQYQMYCNTSVHDFHYYKYHYHCFSDNCGCIGNKDTCVCKYNMSSSCFCTNNNNSITIPAAVRPVYDCGLYNDTYICTGAQYRMHCNTRMHYFDYWKYQYQNQDQYQYECWSNNCYCFGNKDTCTCYSSTLSSCFCETNRNYIALTTAVSPVYDCGLYDDTYICTGAQYHMYCDISVHDFYYWNNHYYCFSDNCGCIGDQDTCVCNYMSSSCFCTNNNNSITIPAAVRPVYDCGLYNDTYICTGAQYRMHCNTRMHSFYYWKYQYQNQDQNQFQCWSNNCYCVGNKDTCTCYSSTLSSCFCETNIYTPNTLSPTTTGLDNIDNMPDQCRSQNSTGCFQNLLDKIENITDQELSLDTVTTILTMAFNASEKILESSSSVSPTELASYANRVLKISEKLISTLVKPTDTSANVSFTLATVEGQVFMVGPNVALDKIPRLDTTSSSVDIDLIGIAKNNSEGSAAVAFMSFNTMENLLKPDFFNTSNDAVKTMMSTVISATLPKTTNTKLTKPVNFTLKHIREFDPSGSLSCVYWNISEWIVDGCSVLKTNSSYTVCSCVHLSTFALMQTSRRPSESAPRLDLLILVCVIVGLVFLSSALLTFALCRWTRMCDWIVGHSGCVRLVPGGYVREMSGNSTGSASDVFAVDSNPTTSEVSQEKHSNVTLNLERVNQNIYTNA
ncbi:uncharacterized protein LOC130070208 [Rhinichthys klamathensis goyatoka]|uniref:uncharacterized protein LOC130070208 n=1 Tax=Rhinichthys klamathensis goyatoka TaxID=3034132 RepID=UPI0024B56EDA|nr:uncharacterized protein LOC130070208 [Rhinichthys klamathensis goyatoka]